MDDIKEKLLQMQATIVEAIEIDREKSESAITHDIGDDVDYASEERDRELYQILGDRDRQKLDQIELALERIEDKTYGECDECGSKIQKKRLMVLPFTRLCIECKSEEERTKGKDGASYDMPNPNYPSYESDL